MTNELPISIEIESTRDLRENAIKAFAQEGFEQGSKAWEVFNTWMGQEETLVRKAKDFHHAQLRLSMKIALFYEKIGYTEAAINAYNIAWHHALHQKRNDICWFCEAWLLRLGSDVHGLPESGDFVPEFESVLDSDDPLAQKIRKKVLRTDE